MRLRGDRGHGEERKASIDPERCSGCGACLPTCPAGAIQIDWNQDLRGMQERMVEYAYGAIAPKRDRAVFVNFLLQISPLCDCYPFADTPLVPDVGILASTDPVAIDQASVDLVNAQPGTRSRTTPRCSARATTISARPPRGRLGHPARVRRADRARHARLRAGEGLTRGGGAASGERAERIEDAVLHPRAARAAGAAGRARPEEPCPLRTDFQRDRDRILHAKSFRRLKHKTQVFLAPQGDHYRTRLTHTLEVTQIARTVARALRLNEDLTEAIALGHDLGHTPFGHAGEKSLRAILPGGFRHVEQSVRVVDGSSATGAG